MLNELASSVSFFGVFLTAVVYLAAVKLQAKTKLSFLNPLIVSCAAIILLLLLTGISPAVFSYGRPLDGGRYDGTGSAFFQILYELGLGSGRDKCGPGKALNLLIRETISHVTQLLNQL